MQRHPRKKEAGDSHQPSASAAPACSVHGRHGFGDRQLETRWRFFHTLRHSQKKEVGTLTELAGGCSEGARKFILVPRAVLGRMTLGLPSLCYWDIVHLAKVTGTMATGLGESGF